jgi:hypothetical protein
MHVTYTPPLMAQIRAARQARVARASHPVVIRKGDAYVPEVDPRTRESTGRAQQFRRDRDGRLTILHGAEWVADPTIVDVQTISYG